MDIRNLIQALSILNKLVNHVSHIRHIPTMFMPIQLFDPDDVCNSGVEND